MTVGTIAVHEFITPDGVIEASSWPLDDGRVPGPAHRAHGSQSRFAAGGSRPGNADARDGPHGCARRNALCPRCRPMTSAQQ
jgi:hypothetical protein